MVVAETVAVDVLLIVDVMVRPPEVAPGDPTEMYTTV